MTLLRPILLGACSVLLLAAAGERPPDGPRLAEGAQYDACLGQIRTDAEGARSMAEAWEASGGGEGARHCGALALLGMGEPERAAERLEQLGRASRAGAALRASLFAQAGQAWMMAGDGSRAFGATTMGLALAPDDTELLLDRAVALGTLSRFAEALEDADRVLALNPDRAEAWVFRAAANRHLDKVGQAAEDVARALALAPENAEAMLERGIIRQMQGDTAGAKQDWERAVRLAPGSATADLALQNLALNEAVPTPRRPQRR